MLKLDMEIIELKSKQSVNSQIIFIIYYFKSQKKMYSSLAELKKAVSLTNLI